MSDQDDLRVRLARLDPASTSDPVESPRAQELLERIMATPVLPDTSESGGTAPARRRRSIIAVAAAAAVIAVGSVSVAIALNDHKAAPTKVATNLDLRLPAPAPGIGNTCIRFEVDILKTKSPAFAGTVTASDASHVVLDVDHWYAGGSADTVTLAVPEGQTDPELAGVPFEVGKRYLVTADDGIVAGCGYSGLATPDLEAAFTEAFGG